MTGVTTPPNRPDDPYSRVHYRRLIAWERRIAREGPFLLELLDGAPDRSVLDLGCGTGEHTAFFAQEGARAVGVDRSESMIESARDHEAAGHGRFVLGDLLELPAALADHTRFGLAICLGNTLPHLREDDELDALLAGAHGALLPGGALLIQILNYEGILATGRRHLPVNVRPGDGEEEIVFLRLLKDAGNGRIHFFPATLELDPEAEEDPIRVIQSRRVELRAWTRESLAPRLQAAGFEPTWCGDMQGGPFEPLTSPDLVLVARR
jgi:SAM-dependent methyltransferase